MYTTKILRTAAFVALAMVVAACGRDKNDPGIQYAPEMYESIPYEPFKQVMDSTTPFRDGQTMQLPPEGTIRRGGVAAFPFPNSEQDSVRRSPAVKALKNPVPLTKENLAEGQELYTVFCGICHGPQGKGNGNVAKHDAINPVAYDDARLSQYTAGEIYYVIMHGKGVMGSYASQLDHDQRWKVVHFVQTLQGNKAPEFVEQAPEFHLADINYDDMNVGDRYQLTEVYFESQDSNLTENSLAILGELITFLKDHPSLQIEIGGHTDGDGDDAMNMELSKKRAASVVSYMVEQGIAAGRLSANGYGETQPIAANDSAENKQLNRRTEIRVVQK